jgi:hypothetical protein
MSSHRIALQRTRLIGGLVLVSLPFWWIALAAWAPGVTGYLGFPGVGTSAFHWILLITTAGTLLLLGAIPRSSPTATRSLVIAAFFLLVASLAVPNLLAGLANGIRPVGLLVAILSVAQAAAVVVGLIDRSVASRAV